MSSTPTTHPALGSLELLRQDAQASSRLRSAVFWPTACFAVDATMLMAACAATLLGARGTAIPSTPALWLAGFAALVLVLASLRGMYGDRLRLDLLEDTRGVVTAAALAAMTVLTVRVLTTDSANLAAEVVRPWAFATVYLAAGRAALYWTQTQARRDGESLRPTLIVGAGRIGHLTAKRLLERPELGLKPVGFLDKEPLDDAGGPLLPVLGRSWDLEGVVEQYGVQHVVVTFSTAPHGVLLRLVERCEALGVHVSFVPRLFEKVTHRLTVDHLGGLPLLTAHATDPKGWQFRVKYAADRAVAAAALLVLAPILAGAALAVWLSLGRPLFFRQPRVGRDGRTFEMLKFRSMRPTGECSSLDPCELPADTGPGGVEGDDRRTRVGSFLRRTSIDELPQLLIVLRGEMSIVGPRPERPEYVGRFAEDIYRYPDRQRVKAGITGWAQVHGLRGKTSLSDRVEWDNYYIENWSLWLDVKILLRTALCIFGSYRTVE